jgi:hypothetical protein
MTLTHSVKELDSMILLAVKGILIPAMAPPVDKLRKGEHETLLTFLKSLWLELLSWFLKCQSTRKEKTIRKQTILRKSWCKEMQTSRR